MDAYDEPITRQMSLQDVARPNLIFPLILPNYPSFLGTLLRHSSSFLVLNTMSKSPPLVVVVSREIPPFSLQPLSDLVLIKAGFNFPLNTA
jgi:hypothetical protein